jgi:transcriptional regulator of acetoin/glycerol metabolism
VLEGNKMVGGCNLTDFGILPLRGKNPYTYQKKDRKKILQLWDRFNSDLLEEENISSLYESMILKEWKRCRDLRINADMNKGVMLTADEFEKVRNNNRGLIEKALPVLKNVSQFLTWIPIILILTDNKGNILQVLGENKVRKHAANNNIIEGSIWREELAGNNGLGTALNRKAPVHVFAAEHYCEGWHTWTCAAAPILNPFTGEVIGVVDLTSFEKDYKDEALGLTFSLANQIATELKMDQEIKRIQLINKFIEYSSRYANEGIVVVDQLGHIIRLNENARTLFPDTKFDKEFLSKNNINFEQESVIWDGEKKEIGQLYTLHLKPKRTVNGKLPKKSIRVYGDFITLNTQLRKTLERITKISSTDISVLVNGESGTGKELIASYIHQQSRRKEGPYVPVNCGEISRELFSSKIFGYEKGAFTGADPHGRKGFFEMAHRGTLFLDEIGELPLDIQASLLRVLETKRFRRLGAEQETVADFRIIAATNRVLEKEIQDGNFRSDLYYRLNVAKFNIIPLRERPEDIEYLAQHFIEYFCHKHNLRKKPITPEALEILKRYEWKGNARELKNIIETVIFFSGDVISEDDLKMNFQLSAKLITEATQKENSYNLKSNEKQIIIEALKKYKKLNLVAKELGISRSTLYLRLERFNIDYEKYVK